MKTIAESMALLEEFFADVRPQSRRALRAPMDDAALVLLREHFREGTELEELYSIHDGMEDYEVFLNCQTWLPVSKAHEYIVKRVENAELLSGYDDDCEGRLRVDRHWRRQWWPLTDESGDHLVVDFDPGPKGRIGQVFSYANAGEPSPFVVAGSLKEMLAVYVDATMDGSVDLSVLGVEQLGW